MNNQTRRPTLPIPRGFTLVELLLCMGIIAMLIAIVMPMAARVREQARVVQCGSNLRQIGVSLTGKRVNDGAYPAGPEWMQVVKQETGSEQILVCPSTSTAVVSTPPLGDIDFSFLPKNNPARPDILQEINDDFYIMTISYQHKKPEIAVIELRRVNGNVWVATPTRIDPKKPYGGPPINLHAGSTTINDLKVGQSYTFTSGAVSSHYGYNIAVGQTRTLKPGKVMVMDYLKTTVDYDGLHANDDDPATSLVGRHLKPKRVQVLHTDGSVRLMSLTDLAPTTGAYKVK